jgi:hypothetical protein
VTETEDENREADLSSGRNSAPNLETRTKQVACAGLLERRRRWSLTSRGWLALLLTAAIALALLVYGAHPFLAVTERTETPYLVVEGWVPNYALQESITEFRSNHYRKMFTVGTTILNGVNLESGDNHATYAVKRLAWLGMNPALVQPVPSGAHFRNRTYSSALALKEWLDQNEPGIRSFNLVTVGVHARRSRLLFQEAFGARVQVGIISVEDREYDPKHWWRYSEGVKEVISEGAGYIYARFFFHPGTTQSNN